MASVAWLASLGAVFSFLNKMYPYVVICPADGTYNHLTYFEKKQKYKERTTTYRFPFGGFDHFLFWARCFDPYTAESE